MGGVWLFGFISFILYRAFYAGMNSKSLFYRNPGYREGPDLVFNGDQVLGYMFVSFILGVTWILSLPILGAYKLGERARKKKKESADNK